MLPEHFAGLLRVRILVTYGSVAVGANTGARDFHIHGNGIHGTCTAHLGTPVKFQNDILRRGTKLHLGKTETAHVLALAELEIVFLQVHDLGGSIHIFITLGSKAAQEHLGTGCIKRVYVRSSSTGSCCTHAVSGAGNIGNILEPVKVILEINAFGIERLGFLAGLYEGDHSFQVLFFVVEAHLAATPGLQVVGSISNDEFRPLHHGLGSSLFDAEPLAAEGLGAHFYIALNPEGLRSAVGHNLDAVAAGNADERIQLLAGSALHHVNHLLRVLGDNLDGGLTQLGEFTRGAGYLDVCSLAGQALRHVEGQPVGLGREGEVMVRSNRDRLGSIRGAIEGKKVRGHFNLGIHRILLHAVSFLDDFDGGLIGVIGHIGHSETGRAAVSGSQGAGSAGLPVGHAAEAELSVFGVLTVLDRIIGLHVGRAVGVHGVRVLHFLAGFAGRKDFAGRTPLGAVQELQHPELVTGSGSTGFEGDTHLGSGLDGAVSIEEPVVTGPGAGNTGALVGDIQFVLFVVVRSGQVEGNILDVTQTVHRVYPAILGKAGGGVVDILHAHLELKRIRDEGFVSAIVGHSRKKQGLTHIETGEGDLVQVQLTQFEGVQRSKKRELDILVHIDIGADKGSRQRHELRGSKVKAAKGSGDIRRRGIHDGRLRLDDSEFIQHKSSTLIEGILGSVEGNLVTKGDALSFHIEETALIGGDEAILRESDGLGLGHFGDILVFQITDLGQRVGLDAIVGITVLMDSNDGIALTGAALDGNLTVTGQVHHTACCIVGHGNHNIHGALSGCGRDGNPFVGHIHGPGTVRVDAERLLRGIDRSKLQIGVAGSHGTGFLELFLLATGEKGQAQRHQGCRFEYMGHFHNIHSL